MNNSVKAFLNSVAYHVDDVPMIDVDEARDTIDEWKSEGINVPDELTAPVLFHYHNDTINARYPENCEPLNPVVDRAIYRFLRYELYDFRHGTCEPISYVQAWFAVHGWRIDEGTTVPDCLTPLAYMRYVNSHHAKGELDKLWITYNDGGEERWVGPFRTISPDHITADGSMFYTVCDFVEDDVLVVVPIKHEITTRDDV